MFETKNSWKNFYLWSLNIHGQWFYFFFLAIYFTILIPQTFYGLRILCTSETSVDIFWGEKKPVKWSTHPSQPNISSRFFPAAFKKTLTQTRLICLYKEDPWSNSLQSYIYIDLFKSLLNFIIVEAQKLYENVWSGFRAGNHFNGPSGQQASGSQCSPNDHFLVYHC